MQFKKPDKGLIVSSAAHAGLLVLAFVGFWQAPKFEDAAESVPVDMISEAQFQQISKGEKPGKDPKPAIKAVKPAEIADIKPDVPLNPVVKDTPPPPPLRPRIEPPEAASEPPPPVKVVTPQPKPEPPAPPPVVRPVEPPPKPVPPVVRAPEPPKAPPPPPEAEVITPKPVPRPDPPKQVAAVPDPPKPPPKPVVTKQPDPPPVPEKPKASAKPVLDQVASLLDASKPDPAAKPNPDSTTKPKHARPAAPLASTKPFDPSAINNILQANASTSKPSASPAPAPASAAGLPTARAPKMSQNMSGQFAGLVSEHYARCWDQSALNTGISYRPLVRVHFRQNGTLIGDPVLVNQPGDGQARAMADSAIRAIRNCGPVPIPPSLLPYYDEWKDSILKMALDGDA